MNDKDRSPFLVMCDIWGVDIALKKAKEIGISLTDEEVKEVERRTKLFEDLSKTLIDSLKTEDE